MSKESAINIVNAFKANNEARGMWVHIDKTVLAEGLIDRINFPNHIDQAGTPFCGPATLTRSLAIGNPDAYAQAAIDLYLTRQARIGNLSVKPGNELIGAIPESKTHVADWIMLASIRDADNWFLSAGGWFGSNMAGISVPSTVESWFRTTGFTKVINQASATGFSLPSITASNAQSASDYFEKGYNVALLIDADLLKTETQDDSISMFPDHWVILNSKIRNAGSVDKNLSTDFSVWTWGSIRQVPQNLGKPLKLDKFLNKYYGFIAAKL